MRFKHLLSMLLAVSLLVGFGVASSQAADTVRIGLDGVMTGGGAAIGEIIRNTSQWAVDEINAKGGITLPNGEKRDLELVVVDDQSKPDIGLNAIRKLVSDPSVLAFMGPDWSSVTYPTLFVGEEANIVQITSSVARKITQEGFKHIFRARSTDRDWMTALGRYVVEELKLRQVAVTFANHEFGRSAHDVVVAVLKEKYNITPLVDVSYSVGDKDFTAVSGKIREAKADVVINLGNEPEGALLIKDLRNLGWKGQFAFNSADAIFVDLARDYAKGTIGPLSWVHTKPDPRAQEFAARYTKKFKKDPIGHAALYYDAVHILAQAISNGGATREGVMRYMKNLERFEGVQGNYNPSAPGGDMIKATVIVRYNDKLEPEVVASYD